MDITIKFNCDNASFDVEPEAEALRVIIQAVEKLQTIPVNAPEKLYDSNGNHIGHVEVSYVR